MRRSTKIALFGLAWPLIWVSLVLAAVYAAGYREAEVGPLHYRCPWPEVIHGVGSDLRTFTQEIDRCRMIG